MARPALSAPHFHNEEAAFAYVEAHLWPEGAGQPTDAFFVAISTVRAY